MQRNPSAPCSRSRVSRNAGSVLRPWRIESSMASPWPRARVASTSWTEKYDVSTVPISAAAMSSGTRIRTRRAGGIVFILPFG